MRLVGITNNGIIAHGVISATFSIQLELEIFVSVDSKIDASNHPAVEFVASKAIPPIVRTFMRRPLSDSAQSWSMWKVVD